MANFERFRPQIELCEGTLVSTIDYESKYEIEAFIIGVSSLHEWNLHGVQRKDRRNLLGKAFDKQPQIVTELSKAFEDSWNEYSRVAKNVRDDSVHLNTGMTDFHGKHASICRKGDKIHVIWPHLYRDAKGGDVELVAVFDEIQTSTLRLIQIVQEVLFQFVVAKFGPPTNSYFTFFPKGRHPALLRASLTPTGVEVYPFPQSPSEPS